MNKAIYIMDMPVCCYDCIFLDDSGDYPYCKVTGETRGYTFRVRENKMDKCPLKEMPEKMDYIGFSNDKYWYGYVDGFDKCIDDILQGIKQD